MDVGIKAHLAGYRKKADRFLDGFFAAEEKEAAKVSSFCAKTLRIYREYMRGGKMARGALVCLGYRSVGGKDEKAILAASAAVEIAHSFIVMHDDWIDNDLSRRGKPTVHVQFEKIHKKRIKKGDARRWAGGMSFVLGDIGCWLAYQLLAGADFPAERKIEAISLLSRLVVKTGFGQFLDITYDLEPGFDWDKIIKIRKLKTAYYTLVMPLTVGICLGGGSKKKLQAAEDFGFPVGIAFQLRDDYLGLYGDPKITGKSASSDLKEGKKTLLMAKALDVLKGKKKKVLEQALGKGNLTEKEVEEVREIVKDSGAVDYCQSLAEELVEKGKKVIPRLAARSDLARIYTSLADYLVKRDK
jgi:geranylgeranyl diphosphate synthase type I